MAKRVASNKKRKNTKKRPEPRPKVAPPILDFPQEGERVLRGYYAIRVGAEPGRRVEVSFDGKTWLECRPAVGYYWFDWNPAKPGRCRIVARARDSAGRSRRSSLRRCSVVAPQRN